MGNSALILFTFFAAAAAWRWSLVRQLWCSEARLYRLQKKFERQYGLKLRQADGELKAAEAYLAVSGNVLTTEQAARRDRLVRESFDLRSSRPTEAQALFRTWEWPRTVAKAWNRLCEQLGKCWNCCKSCSQAPWRALGDWRADRSSRNDPGSVLPTVQGVSAGASTGRSKNSRRKARLRASRESEPRL